ncbi:MAG: succinate dehydrogenase (or fumarate reductase) cytochrome b subunit, b558 family [Bacteroidetes bacterium OLB12]|nr:MAG: succinate dehydrogenase (or fumarate reductase) cytochrome b subunit, b558 family [Bacteroidetes bacterium OLB12]
MKWFLDLFSSSLGRKVLMALTGIFLILFLAVHLAGNLQLLKDDAGKSFNIYADFMGHNPLIQLISKGNFAFILLHAIWGIMLTIKNRKARGPERVCGYQQKLNLASRNMGILGTLILIFLVIHLKDFYGQAHFGSLSTQVYDGKTVTDLYTQVAYWFKVEWYVILYVVCMGALAFHLWHGFTSAFQTLGLNHMKYNPVIKFVGKVFAVVVPIAFAIIPVFMYLGITI